MSTSFRRLFSGCFGDRPSAKPDPRPLLKLRERLEELMEQASKLNSTEENDLKGLEFAINQFQKAADCCSQATADCGPVERASLELQKELQESQGKSTLSDRETTLYDQQEAAFENLKSDADALQVKIGEYLADVDDHSAAGGLLRDHHRVGGVV